MKQRIAYEGSEFTIEWYFDGKGYSQAQEYFREQPIHNQFVEFASGGQAPSTIVNFDDKNFMSKLRNLLTRLNINLA
jgi:hypothetical protein